MSIILYQFPGGEGISSISPPCVKVELALRRCDAPFEVVNCSPKKARRVSPTGKLPVLDLEGEMVDDSICILDALERRFPEAGLAPVDAQERIQDRLWETYVNDYLYWFGFYLRWIDPECSPRFQAALTRRLPSYRRFVVRAVAARRMRTRARYHGVGGKDPRVVQKSLTQSLDMLEQGIGAGPFLAGRSMPGRGDLALAATVVQAPFRDTTPHLLRQVEAHPRLVEHMRATYRAAGMSLAKTYWEQGSQKKA